MQHEVFLGDAVGVMLVDEHTQCSNNHLYAGGCLEEECLVANESDVGCKLAEALYELLRHIVLADEDGNLAEVKAACLQASYLLRHV